MIGERKCMWCGGGAGVGVVMVFSWVFYQIRHNRGNQVMQSDLLCYTNFSPGCRGCGINDGLLLQQRHWFWVIVLYCGQFLSAILYHVNREDDHCQKSANRPQLKAVWFGLHSALQQNQLTGMFWLLPFPFEPPHFCGRFAAIQQQSVGILREKWIKRIALVTTAQWAYT